jgi:hydroxybutyrate-dimer hydrolase
MKSMKLFLFLSSVAIILAACDVANDVVSETEPAEVPTRQLAAGFTMPVRVTEHRDDDDLVSAGLGLSGLTAPVPEMSDPESPTPAELRRLAIYQNWRSIGPLSPAAGLGGLLESLPQVPGREFHAFLTLPNASQPFRVAVQLPDEFDIESPCLVVTAASGSRGIYGAIAVAAPWALPRGCAVAHTDKAAGTDIFDFSDGTGTDLAGQRVRADEAMVGLDFHGVDKPRDAVAMRHAHSGDHPEADWGRHVLAAAAFGLDVLNVTLEGEFSADNTRIIAAAVSNGGNAVLRAAEADDEGLLDAVVSVMPNITPLGQPPLYDYATLAALYQPCLLADTDFATGLPLGLPPLVAAGQVRCESLTRAGMLDRPEPAAAREVLEKAGFDEPALSQAAVNVTLDLWRSVAVTYASSYLQRGPFDMPCGYSLEAPGATAAQRQAWWGSHSGVAPGEGIDIIDTLAEGDDPAFPGLVCLRELATGSGPDAALLQAALRSAQATAFLPDIPVLVVHGRDDGLVPVVFSSRPYVKMARNHGAGIAYWEIDRVQHFDALLAFPGVAGQYAPILPYGWIGMDHVMAVLDGEQELGEDRVISPTPAAAGEPLQEKDLAL